MRTNRPSGKSARPVPPATILSDDMISAAAAVWPRRRFRGASAGSVAAVVAGILGGAGLAVAPAHAQTAQPPQPTLAAPPTGSAQTSQNLQEVVVTATATQVKKLDASYNVVSADDELIKESNPLSSAEILKIAPGIWPEASGGQTGANIEVAGYPSGGDSPFFTNMIMGMPLYGSPNLAYMDSSSLFRLDDSIDRVEVVQGGPSVVFGPGQFGGTANYLLKTGKSSPGGEVGATYGTEGMWRGDAYYGFQIADGWYGSVGGYYNKSHGVRDSQFPAIEGGQFTATLTHDIDGGTVTAWARVLDEKDQYITPQPIVQNADGSYSAFPGFDPLTSTFNGYSNQNLEIANPRGGFMNANLADGRGSRLDYFGINYDQRVGDWTLHNGFLIDGGGLDTNGWFSGSNPRPLSMYLYGCNYQPEPAGWCNGSSPVDSNNLGTGGKGYPLSTNIQAVYAGSGAPVPLSTTVIQQSYHLIQKSLQNVADEFRVSREMFPGNTLTAGLYAAFYTDNDNWAADSGVMTATPNAQMIALSFVDANGNINRITSPQGIVNMNGTYTTPGRHGDGRNIAPYFSDSWRLGPWLLDLGARAEHIDLHQRTCQTSTQMLGTQYDLYDNKVPICNGAYDYEHYSRTMPEFTAGLNYTFSSNMSAYVRVNTGVHFLNFDDISNTSHNTPPTFHPIETARNYEIGYKFQARYLYLDLNGWHRTFDGIFYQESDLSGVPIPGGYGTYGSTANGFDVDGYIGPFAGLTLRFVGDYMDGHYTNNHSCLSFIDIFGNKQCVFINGSPLQRQPKFQVRITPSYSTATPWGDVTAWLTFEHAGQRFNDTYGQQPLGTYNMLSGGILTDIGNNWQLRVQGTNLTNEIALTEGNARQFGRALGIGNVLLARPYEGREVNLTATYKF
ncbi:MAG: TonB-dependent receptor [Gammaproteobacteria bacterium]|nr:TonB-dependent receptor [Gammaproteobacteria bacterium]